MPKVYNTPIIAKVIFVGFGAFLCADGVFLFSLPFWMSFSRGIAAWEWAFFFLLGFAGFGLGTLMIAALLGGHIDLYADAVAVESGLPFGNRRLERKDIAAKLATFIYVPYYVLYPHDQRQKPLRFGVWLEDEYFRQWISSIPDADREFLRKRRFRR